MGHAPPVPGPGIAIHGTPGRGGTLHVAPPVVAPSPWFVSPTMRVPAWGTHSSLTWVPKPGSLGSSAQCDAWNGHAAGFVPIPFGGAGCLMPPADAWPYCHVGCVSVPGITPGAALTRWSSPCLGPTDSVPSCASCSLAMGRLPVRGISDRPTPPWLPAGLGPADCSCLGFPPRPGPSKASPGPLSGRCSPSRAPSPAWACPPVSGEKRSVRVAPGVVPALSARRHSRLLPRAALPGLNTVVLLSSPPSPLAGTPGMSSSSVNGGLLSPAVPRWATAGASPLPVPCCAVALAGVVQP